MYNLNAMAMKTDKGLLRKVILIVSSLFAASAILLADGETSELYLSGNTNSSAGEFVVQTSADLFQFQGRVYEVYKVSYDDPSKNMKIAVNIEGKCNSFVAYNGEFSFFYNCNKYGFGVRRVFFCDPWVHERFSSEEYQEQSIMKCEKVVDKKEAIRLIASYVPLLYREEISN
jgi:hypothetical protein